MIGGKQCGSDEGTVQSYARCLNEDGVCRECVAITYSQRVCVAIKYSQRECVAITYSRRVCVAIDKITCPQRKCVAITYSQKERINHILFHAAGTCPRTRSSLPCSHSTRRRLLGGLALNPFSLMTGECETPHLRSRVLSHMRIY